MAAAVGSTALFPVPPFPVIQGSKVRGVDDASISGSEVNLASSIVENLQVPSTDYNIAVLRSLRAQVTGLIGGWVVDETRAYRQLPVHRDHRRFSVVALWDPRLARVSFWIMLGHSCGLSARRVQLQPSYSSGLQGPQQDLRSMYDGVLRRSVRVLPFTRRARGAGHHQEALRVARDRFLIEQPSVRRRLDLGIRYDLRRERLGLKPDLQQKLISIIDDAIKRDELTLAAAAKLKGKLVSVPLTSEASTADHF